MQVNNNISFLKPLRSTPIHENTDSFFAVQNSIHAYIFKYNNAVLRPVNIKTVIIKLHLRLNIETYLAMLHNPCF